MAYQDVVRGGDALFKERHAEVDTNTYVPGVSIETAMPGDDQTNDATKVRQLSGWAINHAPAANTQATITRAAGAAGVKHVCTGILATFVAGAAAPTAVQVTVNLRDGASGAGTVLWSGVMALPAVAGDSAAPIQLAGLWIEGSAATAMTLEFGAAGGANTVEAVSLCGVDIA